MKFYILNIHTGKTEKIFEGIKDSKEYKNFLKKYPAPKGYCILSITKKEQT